MEAVYNARFDKTTPPNYGLDPPPEANLYIGHFDLVIPLGVDINGTGGPDKLKFTLATHSVSDVGRTYVTQPDGTVLDTFDSAAFLAGAIMDVSADPPFEIGALDPVTLLPVRAKFGGPTTATALHTGGSPVVKSNHERVNDLITLVKSMHLDNGIEAALTAKLDTAVKAIDKRNNKSACDLLAAFLNQINAQTAKKKLTQAQATQLIDAVTPIQVRLGCK